MARILCIDYGTQRCGLAATDVLQIAVHPLQWIPTSDLMTFVLEYLTAEPVESLVLGDGRHADGSDSYVTTEVQKFVAQLSKHHPQLPIQLVDEAFTSSAAQDILLRASVKKKKRREKGTIDKISAVLILQNHLGHL